MCAEPIPLHAPVVSQRPGAPHHTSVIERGAFAIALCSCGWKGPARRARDRARRDAELHVAG
ncbi:hypothetical protein AB0M29_40550 [Streptomyces sp. NPDC051976]|uniref:hypothetical protein n=1 Tax=Streptomyces sp. NPDC051976 TaxID=3154947 RepID=UPI00341F957A